MPDRQALPPARWSAAETETRTRRERSEHHPQGGQASKTHVVPPGDRARGKPQVGKALHQFAERGLTFNPSQRSAKTEVAGPAERDMPVVGSSNIQAVRVRKALRVAVGRAHHRNHRLTFTNQFAAELDVLWSDAGRLLAGRFVAQEFFD